MSEILPLLIGAIGVLIGLFFGRRDRPKVTTESKETTEAKTALKDSEQDADAKEAKFRDDYAKYDRELAEYKRSGGVADDVSEDDEDLL